MRADIEELYDSEPKTAEQLGILVLDGSKSMEGTKAEAVGSAAKQLIARLQGSGRNQDFWLALIAFDDDVEVRLHPTQVTEIGEDIDTNPYLGGDTAIGDALYAAGNIAEDFIAGETDLPRPVVIILMSDGQDNASAKDKHPRSVAAELKQKFPAEKLTICSVAYGKDADEELLREIASNAERGFLTTDRTDRLRNFFLSSILRAGEPA